MKTGKISESILKRSVLKQIKTHREEIIKGAGIGEDCAFLSYIDEGMAEKKSVQTPMLGTSTQTMTLPIKKVGYLAVMAAANNLAASGVTPISASISITLPTDAEEASLKEIMKQIEQGCKEWNMEIAGGHTEISPSVKNPVITVTAMGRLIMDDIQQNGMSGQIKFEKSKSAVQTKTTERSEKNFDLVVSKWIGLEGTFIAASEKEKELVTRYPKGMILAAQKFEELLSVAPEAALALKSGVCRMHDMRNGGIFGALWEISRLLDVGLSIDLKKIPVKQETIEICEFFDLNPYTFLSGGSLLMVTEDGETLVSQLQEAGIHAAVIGQTNSGNDKTVTNRDEVRYLEPTMPDEIYKLTFN